MDTDQTDRHNMHLKVKTFFTNNSAALAAFTAIQAFITALNDLIEATIEELEDATLDISGYSEDEADKREAATLQGLKVAAAAAAKFSVDGDKISLRKVDFLDSELRKKRGSDLYTALRKLHEIADPIQAALLNYNLTPTDVGDLQTKNEAYFTVVKSWEDARSLRSSFNQDVDGKLNATRTLLETKLDPLMLTLKATNPQLHDYYLGARNIDNTGSRNELSGFEFQTFTLAGGESKSIGEGAPQPGTNPEVYIKNNGPAGAIMCTADLETGSCATGHAFAPEEEFLGLYNELALEDKPFVIITNTSPTLTITIKLGTKD